MKLHRTLAVLKREGKHLRRDRRILLVLFLLPYVSLILTANALVNRVGGIDVSVWDGEQTAESRLVLRSLEDTSVFRVRSGQSPEEARSWLKQGKVQGSLLIPPGFTQKILEKKNPQIQVALGVPDPLSTRIYLSHLGRVFENFPERFTRENRIGSDQTIKASGSELNFVTLFNPGYDYYSLGIPALIGCILMALLPAFSSLSIVRERERGIFNRSLASPASPGDYLMGKMFIYVLVGIFHCVVLAGFAGIFFDVPFRGNIGEYLLVGGVFSFWAVMFGLMISTFTEHQSTALIATVSLSVVPAFIFSGLFFPIDALPLWIRLIAYLFPTHFFTEIARGIFLKATHLWVWWRPFAALLVLGLATYLVTYLRFLKLTRGS